MGHSVGIGGVRLWGGGTGGKATTSSSSPATSPAHNHCLGFRNPNTHWLKTDSTANNRLLPSLPAAVTGDTELFLALDPLTDKAEAAGVAGRLGMWLLARHDQLFSL